MLAAARSHALGDLLARSAARDPHRTAIIAGARRHTYAELQATVNRTANAIASRGIGPGDRLAIFSRNSYAFIVTALAMARRGVILVPINFMLGPEEVAYVLGHSGACGLIVEEALLETAEAAVARLGEGAGQLRARAVIAETSPASPAGWETIDDWFAHPDDSDAAVAVADDDPIALSYTSGTESRPKGAVLTSRCLIAQFVSCIVDGEMSAADVEVHAMPLYHCAQSYCFLLPDLYLGATSIVLSRPDPGEILAAIEEHRATKLFAPPTMWIALLRHPDFDTRDLSSLRKAYYGASAMPVEILGELGRRLPEVRLFNFYGQTEMSPMATLLRPEDQVRKAGSAGRASLNVETRIVDPEGEPLAPGEIGEVVHRSPHAMLEYWNDPERTEEAFAGGWFHSGDLGVLDDEGYLFIVDRKKDMIKTGGENVASREVEETLYGQAGIVEAAVFGIPHSHWIEAVTAVVVLGPDAQLTPEDVVAFCRGALAPFKVPKYVVIVDELPKNASGKILKRELRERYAVLAAVR